MSERFDCVVVGGGAIGAAIARAILKQLGDAASVLLLERADRYASEISARSSEVVHAGMYYQPGSLKARFCVQGRRQLYQYLEERGVPHSKIGKLIVAQDAAELVALEDIAKRGSANGVESLHYLSTTEVRKVEPDLDCAGALLSSETGIFDSQAYVLSLIGDFEDAGGLAVLRTEVKAAWLLKHGVRLETADSEGITLETSLLVNAAGLSASALSAKIEGIPAASIPRPRWAKGTYFTCRTRPPFSRLLYPVPETGGLGVHLTFDLGGKARFGPDVEWVDEVDYAVDAARSEFFYRSVRRYWPGLPDGALVPAYSGVRPKVEWGDDVAQDFIVQGPSQHAGAKVIALYGIESPGLTSSLAIADAVASLSLEALSSSA